MLRKFKQSLADVAIFSSLSETSLRALEERCSWRTYQRGELIIGHLDDTDGVFFVTAGSARVIIYSASGRAVAFRDIGAGDMVGEFAALDHEPRSASVEALDSTSIAIMPSSDFRAALETDSQAAMALLIDMVGRLRQLTSRVYEFSTLAVQNRIHAELLRLARQTSSNGTSVEIEPAPTHADIAGRISTHREAVSREFSRLARLGLLERTGGKLLVTDIDRLSEMVEKATQE